MAERTKFQQKVIKSYYDNRDGIAIQRVQELVTELYLSEGKKRAQHWKNLTTHLQTLGVSEAQIARLKEEDNPELVANLAQKLLNKTG